MIIYKTCKICNAPVHPFIPRKRIVQCSGCGLIFFNEALDPGQVEKLYAGLYNNENPAYKAHIFQQQLISKGIQPQLGYNRVKVIKKIIKHLPSAIGEIGAGVGVTGKYLQDKKISYTGFEIDATTASNALKAGININAGGFEQLQDYTAQFDALFAFEVIEHIDDLKKCIGLIHQALKPSGRFGFTVPNYNKIKNYTGDPEKLHQPNPPVHVNFFTIENISGLLPRFGFKIDYLAVRPIPEIHVRILQTYRHLWRKLTGRFEGSTIMCVAVKE